MADIQDVLGRMNPWWYGESAQKFARRKIYEEITRFLHTPQIIALTGLRRVGKTALMHNLVQDYIGRSFDPKNILYFSFDDYKASALLDVIREYESMHGKNLRDGNYLILFDEIQKLEGWQEKIKVLYDAYKPHIKFIISGSESLFIRKKAKESLAGRIFEFRVEQLTFSEFLDFLGKKPEPGYLHRGWTKNLLGRFIATQGFPEMTEEQDRTVIRKYVLENVVEKALYRDIPAIFKIDNVEALASMLRVLMEEPGQLIEYSKLAADLNLSRISVSNYLGYLGDAFLVRKLYNYSRNARKTERSLKKFYPTVISPDLTFNSDTYSRSKVFEWFVVNQLRAEFFWRDSWGHEVDVITREKGMPIEIKYGKLDFDGVLEFMDRFGAKKGYIVSREAEDTKIYGSRRIDVVPVLKVLLQDVIE